MKKQKDARPAALLIDATGAPAGRLAAFVAKQALCGAAIDIVNVDLAVITGNPDRIVEKYAARRHMTQKANPEHAAKWPRRPDYLFKVILKGMLPKRTSRSKDALSRTMAHIGAPEKLSERKAEKFAKKQAHGMTLMELCRALGLNK